MVLFSFVIVRHGETQANVDGIMQGQSDFALNGRGQRQAHLLSKAFKNGQYNFSHIFSSDLSRATETTSLIVDGQSRPASLVLDKRLRERKFGVLEGKPASILRDLAMGLKKDKKIWEVTPEGGETLRQVYCRVVAFFNELCNSLKQQFPSPANCSDYKELPHPRRMSRNFVGADNAPPEKMAEKHEALVLNGKKIQFAENGIDHSNCDKIIESGSVHPLNVNEVPSFLHRSSSTTSTSSLFAPQSPGGRKISMASITSDDGCFPELDAQVLVVSHGGAIRELFRYFCDELSCMFPGGKGAAFRVSPNAGYSSFTVNVDSEGVSVTSCEVHVKDHILNADPNFDV